MSKTFKDRRTDHTRKENNKQKQMAREKNEKRIKHLFKIGHQRFSPESLELELDY